MRPQFNRKKRLHRKLMTILGQMGIDDDMRHDMIWRYTGGRTASSRELTQSELEHLISRLEDDRENKVRRLRSTILEIATRTGIHDPNDWSKFNGFMLNRSVYKKPLPDYTYKELKQLLRQFRGIERAFNRAAVNPRNRSYWKKRGLEPSKN